MRKLFFSGIFFFSFSFFSQAQFQLGVFAGASNYEGDLTGRSIQQLKPAIGISAGYGLSDRFTLRAGLNFGTVAGADKYSHRPRLVQVRNLSFESKLTEFNLLGELTIFNLNNINWSPYIFAGLAVFHFDPYTYDSLNQKVYLKPLSTEGQGLPQYPERKPYALTQLAIPFGGGIKLKVSDKVRIGLEVGIRKLSTDYLDDVSTDYADPTTLLIEKGPQAVSLAYRGDEAPNGVQAQPVKGDKRGNPKIKDWYLFSGVHVTFQLGGGYARTPFSRYRSRYGCPANPL